MSEDVESRQVGGDHYKGAQVKLQHWDFVQICLGGRYLEGQVTKYLCRWDKKNGLEDLQKAAHYLDKLIQTAKDPAAKYCPQISWTIDQTVAREKFLRSYGMTQTLLADTVVILTSWHSVHNLERSRDYLARFIYERNLAELSGTIKYTPTFTSSPPCEVSLEEIRADAKAAEGVPVKVTTGAMYDSVRPDLDEWGLSLAEVVARRGTCSRRKVGCVLVDFQGKVLSTGYNGVARGLPHCSEAACAGAGLPSGSGLEQCEAIHAEQNALMQCAEVNQIFTAYVTNSPCLHCVKMLLNTGCKRIVFRTPYAHDAAAKSLWMKGVALSGRAWVSLPSADVGETPVKPLDVVVGFFSVEAIGGGVKGWIVSARFILQDPPTFVDLAALYDHLLTTLRAQAVSHGYSSDNWHDISLRVGISSLASKNAVLVSGEFKAFIY